MKSLKANISIMTALVLLSLSTSTMAQEQDSLGTGDTVIVNFGESSKIVFHIKKRTDLNILKQYDLDTLLKDFSTRIENTDQKGQVIYIKSDASQRYLKDSTGMSSAKLSHEAGTPGTEAKKADEKPEKCTNSKSYSNINIELGTSNYLSDGKFPSSKNALYAVRPWGSRYLDIKLIQVVSNSKNFHIELGAGVSWYSFKFQNDKTRLEKREEGTFFYEDSQSQSIDYKKSRLTIPYANVSILPTIKLGSYKNQDEEDCNHSEHWGKFRLGLGGFAGYRIGGNTKIVYKKDDRKRENTKSDYFLSNFRYGIKARLGFMDFDTFITYDLNELFIKEKGPQLHALAIGISI